MRGAAGCLEGHGCVFPLDKHQMFCPTRACNIRETKEMNPCQLEELFFLKAQDILGMPNANIWKTCSEGSPQGSQALNAAIAPADSAELPVHQTPTDIEMSWVEQACNGKCSRVLPSSASNESIA